ncbi:hypothetical protein MMC17_009874 [Xylographa soralifera]|nr:hypothetical protein [Xylographa soralifera]
MAPVLKIPTSYLENCVDQTSPQPIETVRNPIGEPALAFGGTENAQVTASEEDSGDLLLSLEELLRDTGEAQVLQRAAISVDYGNDRADGAVENPTLNECDNSPTPRPSRERDERKGTAGAGSVLPRGDGSVSDEPGGQQAALRSPSTAAPDSEAGTAAFRGSALKEIGPVPSGDRKGKADKGDDYIGDGDASDGDRTAKGAKGVRASLKRTADNTGLNEEGEGLSRSEKISSTRWTMPTMTRFSLGFDRNQSLSSNDLRVYQTSIHTRALEAQIHSVGLVTVSVSPPPGGISDHHPAFPPDTIIDNPVVLEDDGVAADKSGAFAKATSVEP